jgi:hypothetical protein
MLCWAQVRFIRALAPGLILALSLALVPGGGWSRSSLLVQVACPSELRATEPAETTYTVGAVRPLAGLLVSRDNARVKVAARSGQITPGFLAAANRLAAPRLAGPLLNRHAGARALVSPPSSPPRGPPQSI